MTISVWGVDRQEIDVKKPADVRDHAANPYLQVLTRPDCWGTNDGASPHMELHLQSSAIQLPGDW
jgi:hypothetical protein